MNSCALRNVVFLSTNLILAASFIVLDFWQTDAEHWKAAVARRVEENLELLEKLEEAKKRIRHLESHDCEVSLKACEAQEIDKDLKLSERYTLEGSLDVCQKNLTACLYENIETRSECGI